MKYIILTLFVTFSTLFSSESVLTGTVISNNQKMIPARYMGYVKKINFEVGDMVAPGMLTMIYPSMYAKVYVDLTDEIANKIN